MSGMTVYVLETGRYDQRGVSSVHSTLAGAQAAITYPGVTWLEVHQHDLVWWDAVGYPDGATIFAWHVDEP